MVSLAVPTAAAFLKMAAKYLVDNRSFLIMWNKPPLVLLWVVPDHQDSYLTTFPKTTIKRETSKQMVSDRNMPLGLLQEKMMTMMMMTKILMFNCLIVGLVTL